MNIVTPILTALAYPTANVNTESARRDNALRETIPQSADAEKGASQKGLGSESDKTKNPGLPPAPVTYERPQAQTDVQSALGNPFEQQKDNASDESAGKQDAQDKQQSEQQLAQQQEIDELEARDREVRTHEQAHAAAGGHYAGSPNYEYTTGPDNKRYVTDGEVSIDVSELATPEQTLRKMQQVRTAALAPAQPSEQDLKVASEAAQKAAEARNQIAQENRDAEQINNSSMDATDISASKSDRVDGAEQTSRRLDNDALDVLMAHFDPENKTNVDVAINDVNAQNDSKLNDVISARVNRIQKFYTQTYTPVQEGFSAQV